MWNQGNPNRTRIEGNLVICRLFNRNFILVSCLVKQKGYQCLSYKMIFLCDKGIGKNSNFKIRITNNRI